MIYYISKEPIERFDVIPFTYVMLTDAKTHCQLFDKTDPVIVELTEDAPIDYLPVASKVSNLMIKLSDETPITEAIIMRLNKMFPQFSGLFTKAYLMNTEEEVRELIKSTFSSSYELVKEANL